MPIVPDNAAGFDQVTSLLPDSPNCAVVITSRNGLASLPVSLRIVLGALPRQEALRITRLIGAARVEAGPSTAHRILTACGGLPLAVRIIGSRLAARPEWALAALGPAMSNWKHFRCARWATQDPRWTNLRRPDSTGNLR